MELVDGRILDFLANIFSINERLCVDFLNNVLPDYTAMINIKIFPDF